MLQGQVANCRSLTTGDNSTLYLYGTLNASGSVNIGGTLSMSNPAAILNVSGNITWESTSDINEATAGTITVSRNWSVDSGADVSISSSTVNFVGSQTSKLLVLGNGNCFYHLNINKQNSYLWFSEYCNSNLLIRGNLNIALNAALNCERDIEIEIKGNLVSNGGLNLYAGGVTFSGTSPQTSTTATMDFFQALTVTNSTTLALNGYTVLWGSLNILNNSTVNLNNNISVRGSIYIQNGTLNAGSQTISVYGSWINDSGPGSLTGNNHKVKFCASDDITCYETDFKTLELYLDSNAEMIIPQNKSVICTSYDWTLGAIRVSEGAFFTANDLADIRVKGRFYLDGGQIDLHQDVNAWVDIDADIFIYDGVFNIHGGYNYPSTWAYTRAIVFYMEDGELNFLDNGVKLNNTGYYLNENISGGIIRVNGDFKVERPGFNPTGGTIELIGSSDAAVYINSPSKAYNLEINKTARNGESRTNKVTITANTQIDGYCKVQSGSTLKVDNNVEFKMAQYLDVYGTLEMSGANAIIDIYSSTGFRNGSVAN